MSSSRQSRRIGMGIVPRLAINNFLNMARALISGAGSARLDYHQGLPVFDGLAVLAKYLGQLTPNLGLDLVHHLHRFDNAQHLTLAHAIALFHERVGIR